MNRLLLAAALCGLLFVPGCDDPEDCRDFITCTKTGEKALSCCSSSGCRYRVGSREFPCDGFFCSATASQVVTYCTTDAATP